MVERIIHRRTKTSSTNSREQVKYTSIPDIHFGPALTTIGTIQYALHSYILNGLSEQHSQVIHTIKATKNVRGDPPYVWDPDMLRDRTP